MRQRVLWRVLCIWIVNGGGGGGAGRGGGRTEGGGVSDCLGASYHWSF